MSDSFASLSKTWRCSRPKCSARATGMGEPTGLRAIGWQVDGPSVRCPLHRAPRVACRDALSHGVGSDDGSCAICTAEGEAKGWQAWIAGMPAGETLGDDLAAGEPGEEAPWKA